MIFARPELLLWGSVLAVLPILIHLLRPRPWERRPLPTARFLQRPPRLRIRVRRPDRLLLLALRSGALLLLVLALAGPARHAGRAGTERVVIVDGGAGMETVWSAVAGAVERLGTEGSHLYLFVPGEGGAGELQPLPGVTSLPNRPPSSWETRYSSLLLAAAGIAVGLSDPDSVSPVLVTWPRWSAWAGDEPEVRPRTWPGGVEIVPLTPAEDLEEAEVGSGPASARVVLPSDVDPEAGRYVRSALEATRGGPRANGRDRSEAAAGVTVLPSGPGSNVDLPGLLAEVERGDTLLLAGPVSGGARDARLPWRWNVDGEDVARPSGAPSPGSPGAGLPVPGAERWILLDPWGPPLPGPPDTVRGEPAPGTRLLAVGGSGRPVAASVRVGEGCVVYLAARLDGGDFVESAGFPSALEFLLSGCRDGEGPTLPLDGGALRHLGGEQSTATSWGSLARERGGDPVWLRVFLAGAFLCFLAERILVLRSPVGRSPSRAAEEGR